MIIYQRGDFQVHVRESEVLAVHGESEYLLTHIDASTLGSDIQMSVHQWLCSEVGRTFLDGGDPYYYSTMLVNFITGISPISIKRLGNLSFIMRYSFGSIIVDVRASTDTSSRVLPVWVNSHVLGHDMGMEIPEYWAVFDRLFTTSFSWEV